jgi:hypothetical protein
MGNMPQVRKPRILPVIALMLLTALMSVANAQEETVSYRLDDIVLADGTQITGAFDWTYMAEDFEGGNGVFTALQIPWRPNGSAPPLEQNGMVLTIEDKQIEMSLDGNFHDYGLDISLKFVQGLSTSQSTIIDLASSFFECCGNGFKDQPFISGSISVVTAQVVNIDVDPYSASNKVHPHHDGNPATVLGLNDVIPVVVFSSSTLVGDAIDFAATDIDPDTVTFGPDGGGIAPGAAAVMDQDFDNDGILDAKFDFLTGDAGIGCLETEVTIKGETIANELFVGVDSISADCNAQCH